jgi:hypothetical protein
VPVELNCSGVFCTEVLAAAVQGGSAEGERECEVCAIDVHGGQLYAAGMESLPPPHRFFKHHLFQTLGTTEHS